jgi:P pilus assembly chaperone PapD
MQRKREKAMQTRGFKQLLAVAALAIGAFAGRADAMSVTPVHVEMKSAGGHSRSQITVTNTSKTPLPIETTLESLVVDENGGRKTAKAGDEFLVFPPQAIIPPGGTQVFRLQWVGEPALAQSKSYLFNVSQVPVKLAKGENKVQVVMGFGVVINVAPTDGKPSLSVVGTTIQTTKGKRQAVVTVENPTRTHALLPEGKLSLTGSGWSQSMASAEIREKLGIGLVQPGKKRKFVLPIDIPTNVTTVQASLDYKPKR